MIMRDSTRAGMIPLTTPVVAGYADGLYEWKPADWALFPTAVKLSIATQPGSAADILDVEQGDAVPEDVAGWCDRFQRPGRRRPTVYCSRSAWAACKRSAAGRRVDWWISTLDGTTSVPGAVAVQYVDVQGWYDESTILDPSWVGSSMEPTPQSPVLSVEDELLTMNGARALVWMLRLQLFGPAALGEQNAQAAIDAYAARIAGGENVETVLTDVLDDAQRDSRLLPAFRI